MILHVNSHSPFIWTLKNTHKKVYIKGYHIASQKEKNVQPLCDQKKENQFGLQRIHTCTN